jgi:hypothetical protein
MKGREPVVLTSQPGAPSSPAFTPRLVAISTRKLIVAAMITGLVILIAFTVQVLLIT